MDARSGPAAHPERERPRRTARRITLTAIVLILGAAAYSMLWGRLAPFSPFVAGFERRESLQAIVYFHKGVPIPGPDIVDRLVERVEAWHGLKFGAKPQILICRTDREYRRITGRQARFVAFPVQGRLYVSARALRDAGEGRIHLEVYLAHELSHVLLYRNMSLWRALSYPGWLLEGIAVRSSGQLGVDGYYSKEATFEAIRKGYFVLPDDWGTILEKQKKSIRDLPLENKMWFIYAEFGCLVDRLLEIYGRDRFSRFLRATLTERDIPEAFRRVFGLDYEEFLRTFRTGPP
jgi:hypothetical protein